RMAGISCFIARKTPVRLTAMRRFQSSWPVSSSGVGGCSMPALLTAKSIRPNSSALEETAARTALASEPSATMEWAGRPVSGDGGCRAPTGVRDSSCGLVQVVLVDRDQGDVGPGLVEGEGGGAADADAGSSDEDDLVGEVRGDHGSVLSTVGSGQRVSMTFVARRSAIAA